MPDELEPQLVRKDERPSFRSANEPGISWLIIIFLLVLLALAVLVFGKSQQELGGPVPTATPNDLPSTSNQPPRIYTISYDAGVFSPTNLRIHAGDTVRFKNDSIFPIRIVSQDLAGFDSIGDVPQGSYFSYTFAARGTFTYYNSHNSDQAGTIIVR
jgi:plastocyanin